jgi:transposase-like protein
MSEDSRYLCTQCYGGTVPLQRWQLGYTTCLPCGQTQALKVRHTVVPMAKSNYVCITDTQMLKQLNKYSNA